MSAPGMALTAQGLQVCLGERQVLKGLDVQIPAGQWTCVVGPNGAGKSTLLKALAGLLPCQGYISWHGQELSAIGRRRRAQTLAWFGQNEASMQDLRVHDVVMLGRLPHQNWLQTPGAGDRSSVQWALEVMRAWDWRDRALGALSAGERQRVLLARALAVRASVLLMDEPLNNLDPTHQVDWLELVQHLRSQGTTVLSVLHEIGMALHADRMIVMQHGHLVHQGPAADTRAHRALESVFEQRIQVCSVNGQWAVLPRIQA